MSAAEARRSRTLHGAGAGAKRVREVSERVRARVRVQVRVQLRVQLRVRVRDMRTHCPATVFARAILHAPDQCSNVCRRGTAARGQGCTAPFRPPLVSCRPSRAGPTCTIRRCSTSPCRSTPESSGSAPGSDTRQLRRIPPSTQRARTGPRRPTANRPPAAGQPPASRRPTASRRPPFQPLADTGGAEDLVPRSSP